MSKTTSMTKRVKGAREVEKVEKVEKVAKSSKKVKATKAPVAMQLKRSEAAKAKKSKKSKAEEIVRPWTDWQFEELTEEDRDIVMDRLQKEVADVAATRSHALLGMNQVTRAVAKGELMVVVFANNPDTQAAFGHLPLLCRQRKVPMCMLHVSAKKIGEMFKFKNAAAIGIKAPTPGLRSDSDDETAVAPSKAKTPMLLTKEEKKKLKSITKFLISKASKPTS